jgi:hypothetical protein
MRELRSDSLEDSMKRNVIYSLVLAAFVAPTVGCVASSADPEVSGAPQGAELAPKSVQHAAYGDAAQTLTVDATGNTEAGEATFTFHYASASSDETLVIDVDGFASGFGDDAAAAFAWKIEPALRGQALETLRAKASHSVFETMQIEVLSRAALASGQGGVKALQIGIGAGSGAGVGGEVFEDNGDSKHQCYLDCKDTHDYTNGYCFTKCYG